MKENLFVFQKKFLNHYLRNKKHFSQVHKLLRNYYNDNNNL